MSVYDRIYEQLKPQLHELENLRVVARNKRTSAIIYSVIIGIITILLTFAAIGTFHSLFAGFIVGAIGVGVAYLVYLKTAKQHVSLFFHTFKADIVRSIAESLEPSMIYKPYQGISKSYFKSIGHYSQKIDRYSSEDQFSGTIGKTELHFSELHAEYETTSTDSDGEEPVPAFPVEEKSASGPIIPGTPPPASPPPAPPGTSPPVSPPPASPPPASPSSPPPCA